MRHGFLALLLLIAASVAALGACEGCRNAQNIPGNGRTDGDSTPIRLYLLSDVAGALEPCGCVKDQLGGMDHFGALVASERPKSKAVGVLSAGPLFFLDMDLTDDKRAQEVAKAETIASSLKGLSLVGFAPGRNDWAGGGPALGKFQQASGAPMLAANLAGAPATKWTIKELGGLRLGLIGVAAPDKADKAKGPLPNVTSSAAGEAVRAGVDALKKDGAQAIIALAAVGRGEAKRIADLNPELLAVVVGSTSSSGEANQKAPPAERIGDVLIVETANHLQTAAELEIFVRDAPKTGLLKIADGTGIERTRKREELTQRIDELRVKIAVWDKDAKIAKSDVDARKADIAKLEAEREALEKTPAPASGNFYRYAMHDIRDKLGADDAVKSEMLSYYKRVNDQNKVAFADKKPVAPAKGEPHYAGVDVCTNCHEDPRAVWDKTSHAHAYETLSKGFKEFNLDCVSCHVTGYDRPGGSTVTHVEGRKDVQCEVCHGPSSLHATATKPELVKPPIPKPAADMCLSCHHPPHVHTFDAKAKMADILGPGHGKPK